MPAHALLSAVNRLLQQVEETSGLPVAVAQQGDLNTLATLRPASPEGQAYLIAYRNVDEASYHVAFEVALLLRIVQVPAEQRVNLTESKGLDNIEAGIEKLTAETGAKQAGALRGKDRCVTELLRPGDQLVDITRYDARRAHRLPHRCPQHLYQRHPYQRHPYQDHHYRENHCYYFFGSPAYSGQIVLAGCFLVKVQVYPGKDLSKGFLANGRQDCNSYAERNLRYYLQS